LSLEDFNSWTEPKKPEETSFSPKQLETEKSAAYEQGYSAGWDDAMKAEGEAQSRIGAEFERHLQEMSFTFHEARAHVIGSVRPVLEAMVETFLPDVLKDTLGFKIIEILEPLIEESADHPLTIIVSNGDAQVLEKHIDSSIGTVFRLEEQESLNDGQVFLKLGSNERKIDLADSVDQFRRSLDALMQTNEKVLDHG
jgi:flagellar assembly protein FliH